MKKLLLLMFALLCAWNTAFATDYEGTGSLTQHSIKHKGVEYSYYLYTPTNIAKDAPLVLFFHGYGGRNIPSTNFGLNPVADKHGFAVCYPVGPKDFKGKNCWSVGYSFHIDNNWERDDVGFTIKLVKHLQKTHNLSRHNVFVTGHSNGGEMSYLLAYKAPHIFAAVAPISGLTMEWMYRDLKPQRPIPLMEVHGTNDVVSKWNGDLDNKDGWGAYIAVPQAVAFWAAVNRCTHEITDELPRNGNQVIAHRYVDGTNGNQVWLYEVVGGTHSWASNGMNTAEEVWKFFSLYIK